LAAASTGVVISGGGANLTAGIPQWLQLRRAGNQFSAFLSGDGISWQQVGSTQTINLASTLYGGMAVASGNTTNVMTATFDNASVSEPP
jgi:hypothetical protein